MKAFLHRLTGLALLLLLMTGNGMAQTVLWQEDFTGHLSRPSAGQNAQYAYSSQRATLQFAGRIEASTDRSAYESPSLWIPKGSTFGATVSLYGASGSCTLSFTSNASVTTSMAIDGGKATPLKNTSTRSNQFTYAVTIPSGAKRAQFVITAPTKQNAEIDNITLSAPAFCRPVKEDPQIGYDQTSATCTLGLDFDMPILNNPYGLPLLFHSSDSMVASIDADGSIRLNGTGVATITATFTGNDTYSYHEATCRLNVKRDAPKGEIYFEGFDQNRSTGGRDGLFNVGGKGNWPILDNGNSQTDYTYCAYKSLFFQTNRSVFSTGTLQGLSVGEATLSFNVHKRTGTTSTGAVSITKGTLSTTNFTPTDEWTTVTIDIRGADTTSFITISGTDFFLDDVSVVDTQSASTAIHVLDADVPHVKHQRYNLLGQPVGTDYHGIVVEQGRKVLQR